MVLAVIPKKVLFLCRLAGAFGIVQSLIWIALCAVAMYTYLGCSMFGDDINNSGNIHWSLVHSVYFLSGQCESPLRDAVLELVNTKNQMVTSYELHIWVALLLAFSIIWFSISLMIVSFVQHENIKHINLMLYTWSAVTLAVMVLDICVGVQFGVSYHIILRDITNGAEEDLLKFLAIGTFILMTITFRGFLLVIINTVLAIVMLVYTSDVNKAILNAEINVQRRHPIFAFEMTNNKDNNANGLKNKPRDTRDIPNGARSNGSVRSDEWKPQKDRRANPNLHRSNVFSYLEEPNSPNALSQNFGSRYGINSPLPYRNWDTPVPAIPEPDYSPMGGRKLKSALKNY